MHPEEIKARMRIAGKTSAMLAIEMEVSPSAISQIIAGKIKSARIQQAIAQLLNEPVEEVFPSDGLSFYEALRDREARRDRRPYTKPKRKTAKPKLHDK